MQGLTSMVEKTDEYTKSVLDDRKRRQKAAQEERRPLKRHKKRISARLVEGRSWPIDAHTGENADIEREDVMAPLPDDMKLPLGDVDEKMQLLRREADRHESFTGAVVPIDEGVLSRRRRERDEELQAKAKVHGEKWTEELVEERLEEAYRTLFRSSVSGVFPREFGNGMPTPIRQMSDLVSQAGNKSLRNAISHRFKGAPSVEEVRRAEDALGWAMAYLNDEHPDLAGFVNLGAMWKAWGAKITAKCKAHGISRPIFYRDRKEAVRAIVAGLIKDGKAPT
jgi:hypothetical protein